MPNSIKSEAMDEPDESQDTFLHTHHLRPSCIVKIKSDELISQTCEMGNNNSNCMDVENDKLTEPTSVKVECVDPGYEASYSISEPQSVLETSNDESSSLACLKRKHYDDGNLPSNFNPEDQSDTEKFSVAANKISCQRPIGLCINPKGLKNTEKTFVCLVCRNFKSVDKGVFLKHLENCKHGKTDLDSSGYVMSPCENGEFGTTGLTRKEDLSNSVLENINLICFFCSEKFADEQTMKLHQHNVHQDKMQYCDQCDKTYFFATT